MRKKVKQQPLEVYETEIQRCVREVSAKLWELPALIAPLLLLVPEKDHKPLLALLVKRTLSEVRR